MERIKNLLLFLEKSSSKQEETLKEIMYLFKDLVLEINADLADKTAEAMKERKRYKLNQFITEYKNNLEILKQIENVLNLKENKENKYDEILKELNESKTPPFIPKSYSLKKEDASCNKKEDSLFVNKVNSKNNIPENIKMINDLIMEQFSD